MPEPGASPDRGAPRILIVDDEPLVTRILRSMLEIEGYQVLECWSSVDLVERVIADPPDLLILDHSMPQVTGLEVLVDLGHRMGDRVPVILLSGESDAEVPARAREAGALEYLLKPVAMERLHGAVRHGLVVGALRAERDRLRALVEARTREGPELGAQAFEAAWEPMLLLDPELRIRALNPAARRLLAVPQGQGPGEPASRYLGDQATPSGPLVATGHPDEGILLPGREPASPPRRARVRRLGDGTWLVLLEQCPAGSPQEAC